MWFANLFLLPVVLMNIADLKKHFGDKYPAAVTADGIHMPLRRESRFSRNYRCENPKMGCEVSRFMDGSATISAKELEQEWASWDEDMRLDFCRSSAWLHGQPDFPEMIRFIVQQVTTSSEWGEVALSVASELPRDEAFGLLVRALHHTTIGETSNLAQAIAATKHPDAVNTLRNHLAVLWAHPALWDKADSLNWVAFDATTCIAHLIELGAPPLDFSGHVRQLSEHVCPHNRDSCSNFLSKYYSWLKP